MGHAVSPWPRMTRSASQGRAVRTHRAPATEQHGRIRTLQAWIDTPWDLPASAPEWPDDVVMPEKMHVVAIERFGKYRVGAAINSRNLIQRLKTTVNIECSDFVAVFEALGDEERSLQVIDRSRSRPRTSRSAG